MITTLFLTYKTSGDCLLGVMLVGSAVSKLAQIPKIVENFRVVGYVGSRLT